MLRLIIILSFFSLTLLLVSCNKNSDYKNLDCSGNHYTYENAIKKIIDANCLSSGCHGPGSANGNYSNYQGVLIRIKNGTFEKRVLNQKDMPKDAPPLSLDERRKIKCWIDAGAAEN